MDIMLSGLEFAIAYPDDILMNIQSAEQHKAHVYEVFMRIQDYGFKFKEGMCNFFIKKYLSQIIGREDTRPDPERDSKVGDQKAPF